MVYDARKNELREMVRTQFPGMEVGTVDEATLREKEKKAILDAIDKYGSERSTRFEKLISSLDASEAEKNWSNEVATLRSAMRSLFADCLRPVTTPTMLGLKIVVGGADEEDKVCDLLDKAKQVGAALDAIVVYRKELADKTDALGRKWEESARMADSIMRAERDVLGEIQNLMKQAVETQAQNNRNRREMFRAFVSHMATATSVVGTVLPLPPEASDIFGNLKTATEAWEKMSGDLDARKARYESYFSQDHASLLVMFKGTREDARDFLDKHDYTRLVLDWTSKARNALSDLRSGARTGGQKTDLEALSSAATSKLEDAEKAAKSQWDSFVSGNQTKFFGAFTPELDKALIGSSELQASYRNIASIDLQGLLGRWIDDDSRDWREVDGSAMPESFSSELRQSFKDSLEKLAKTEEEIKTNTSPDVLLKWIAGKGTDLADKVR